MASTMFFTAASHKMTPFSRDEAAGWDKAARRRRVLGDDGKHVVIRQLGRKTGVKFGVDGIHVHQIRVEQKHERRFHDARMFKVPTGKAIGIQLAIVSSSTKSQ